MVQLVKRIGSGKKRNRFKRVMDKSRERILINGMVQGVGFRPFIYRIAKECSLSGFVNNNSSGVLVEIEGSKKSINSFHNKLATEAPPFSNIISIDKEVLKPVGYTEFKIIQTDSSRRARTLVSPDIAVCDDCLKELSNPGDRRYQYPFINCTNCGPRYTIIKSIPYDRPFTSMNVFTMCLDCEKEYSDPLNRRFHAQPNACPKCGPSLSLKNNKNSRIETDNILEKTVNFIKEGKIIAIRGLGGYHLAVDPFNESALKELRNRKGRQGKPFALMARNIESIEKYCDVSDQEKQSLLEAIRPIVILSAHKKSGINEHVAPKNNYLGFMLPYTPLHHLLMKYFDVLVMTSANFSDEPIAIGNDESTERLHDIADYFLIHNREILQRCDDSIVRVQDDKPRLIRRSRGYVPAPVFIKGKSKQNILAVGGELKNTIALLRDNEVFLSQHIGDLDNPLAYQFFENSIEHLKNILQIEPQIIVCDLHPEYLSTKWAKKQKLPLVHVQHHHAHLAAVLAENQIDDRAIGIILDGTGYGTDGTIWGGEVLIGNTMEFERYAWLNPVAMPGGGAAIKEPWRMAYSYLRAAYGDEVAQLDLPFLKSISATEKNVLDKMIDQNINAPLTSSCGRLFDAVSAIIGVCSTITFEAQAAIELEMLADATELRYYNDVLDAYESFTNNLMFGDLIKAIVRDFIEKKPVGQIVSKFHNTVAEVFIRVAESAKKIENINRVALSGGVYQNRFLFDVLNKNLTKRGFEVISHYKVPTNDGGLALGQIAVGRNINLLK